MENIVDARGLSCPQPVLMAINEMKKLGTGQMDVLVDMEVSKENVSRAAGSQGWEVVEIQQQGEVFRLTLEK